MAPVLAAAPWRPTASPRAQAERNTTIERENKILLAKMYTIMNSEPAYKTDTKVNVNSLNMTVRKQEYDRIARENQAIMQRILHREPHFNRAALEEDWRATQGYLRNICEYPFVLGNLPPATRKRTLKPLKSPGASPAKGDTSGSKAGSGDGAPSPGKADEAPASPGRGAAPAAEPEAPAAGAEPEAPAQPAAEAAAPAAEEAKAEESAAAEEPAAAAE